MKTNDGFVVLAEANQFNYHLTMDEEFLVCHISEGVNVVK